MKLEVLIMTAPLLLAAVIFQFMPLLTRRGIFFGATVDPAFPQSSDGRRLLRSYRLQVAAWSVLAIGLGVLLWFANPVATLTVPLLLLLAGVGFSYWLKFRHVHACYGRTTPDVRVAELSPVPQQKSLSQWLCIPPFVWLVGVAFYLQAHWYQLPERFPIHWGANGQPNGWATRTFQGVYGPLLLAAFMDVFFLLFAMALLRISRNTIMRHVTVTILLLLMYPVSFAFGMVSLLPLVTMPLWLIPAVTLVFVAVLLVWSIVKVTAQSAVDMVPDPRARLLLEGRHVLLQPR